jgi:hypothetical protein
MEVRVREKIPFHLLPANKQAEGGLNQPFKAGTHTQNHAKRLLVSFCRLVKWPYNETAYH